MSRLIAAIAALIVGCSGSSYQSAHDSALGESAVDAQHPREIDSDPAVSIDSGVSEACTPEPREDACSDVSCGAARNGCGGYYLCVVEPVSTCEGCALEDGLVCPLLNPAGYRCASNLLPIGCIDIGDGLWCCADF